MTSSDTLGLPGYGAIDVHVVRMSDDVDTAALYGLLDSHETHRANRLQGPARQRYVAERAALRTIVSRYLDIPAADVEFTGQAGGAPRLATTPGRSNLAFSFSGSGGLSAVAVTAEQPVGVDVESLTLDRFSEDLAEVALCDAERVSFLATAVPLRPNWLASAWVAKEAVLKALGCGLAVAPDMLDAGLETDGVSTLPGRWRRMRNPAEWWVWEAGWTDACLAVAAMNPNGYVRLLDHPITSLCPG